MNITVPALLQFNDLAGTPVDSGFIYFGVANGNPETQPITVFWDAAGTVAAAQPIRTLNGYPVRNGAASPIYTNSDYSITVRDKNGVLITSYTYTAAAGVSSPPPAVSGATNFTQLLDTFASYAGKSLKPLRVNLAESGLETYTPSAAANTFLALADAPHAYTGKAAQAVIVNGTETGLDFDGVVLGDGSYRLLADQGLSAGTATTLQFAIANYDSFRRGTFSTVNFTYTAGSGGARILINVKALCLAMAAGDYFELWIEKNSITRVGYDKEINELTSSTQQYTCQISRVLSLAAGDTVRVRAQNSAARSISSALENTWIDIVELG